MGLELLREADYVLNACGRIVPPPGYKFVDLTRAIPFRSFIQQGEGFPNSTPSAFRLANNYRTLFICKGIVIPDPDVAFQIRWPSGRFLFQTPPTVSQDFASIPNGRGGAMLALNAEEPLPTGARFAVSQNSGGTLNLQFWGVVRYLLHETDDNGMRGQISCIVGYPAEAQGVKNGKNPFQFISIPDPVAELEARPRYVCGPNQNIMDPEFLQPDVGPPSISTPPPGFDYEPFTFFSDPFEVLANERRYNLPIIVPYQNDVILRRFRLNSVADGDAPGGVCFSMRLPNGYGVTGGDLIPAALLGWTPFFTTCRLRGGDRIIADLGDVDASDGSSNTTTFEFDCWKRVAK